MALVLILTSAMCVIVSADGIITDNDNATLIPSEEPYVENELLVLTREMLDLSGYTQGELFDFFGVFFGNFFCRMLIYPFLTFIYSISKFLYYFIHIISPIFFKYKIRR